MHWGDIMSTLEDVQYIGGCHDTCGGYHDTCGGYHEYIRGCSVQWGHNMSTSGGCSVHWGMFSTSGFSIEIERILSSCSPTCIMISLRCTEHPLMYS